MYAKAICKITKHLNVSQFIMTGNEYMQRGNHGKNEEDQEFRGFMNMYTTNAQLMMDWYKRIFGFEFKKGLYKEHTLRQLYFYYAPVPTNTPWKILNIKGIILHPAYDKFDSTINKNTHMGFEWKDYNGVLREPIYKLEIYIQNFDTIQMHLNKSGIKMEDKSYDLEELLIYTNHISKYRIIDPRDNKLNIWNIERCYKINKITKKRTPNPNLFKVWM